MTPCRPGAIWRAPRCRPKRQKMRVARVRVLGSGGGLGPARARHRLEHPGSFDSQPDVTIGAAGTVKGLRHARGRLPATRRGIGVRGDEHRVSRAGSHPRSGVCEEGVLCPFSASIGLVVSTLLKTCIPPTAKVAPETPHTCEAGSPRRLYRDDRGRRERPRTCSVGY
jgi:hypothetical protein